MLDGRAHRSPVKAVRQANCGDRLVDRVDEEAVLAVADDLGHRSARVRDHRRSARHRLDDAEAERLVEVDEVQKRPGPAEQVSAALGADGADDS